MTDSEQVPRLRELIREMPKKYLLLFLLLGIIAIAGLFWTVAIL